MRLVKLLCSPAVAIWFRAIEFLIVIILLLLTQFSGAVRLGADPTVTKTNQVYFGRTNAQREFGIFVLDGYVFILAVSLVVYSLGEPSRWTNLIFNCFGSAFFTAIALIQLSAWKDPASKINYREEYGVTIDPNFPIAQGAIALVLGFILMLDTCLSLLTIVQEFKNKNSDLPVEDEDKTYLDHQLEVPEDLEKNETRLQVSQ